VLAITISHALRGGRDHDPLSAARHQHPVTGLAVVPGENGGVRLAETVEVLELDWSGAQKPNKGDHEI
jgi:hypothetical protein